MIIEPYPVKTNDYKIVDKGKSYFDTYKIGYRDGEEKTIDHMLEIIEQEMDEVNCVEPKYWLRLNRIRGCILALKGGAE